MMPICMRKEKIIRIKPDTVLELYAYVALFVCVLSNCEGVEQLSSLQHLDLAYNLLLEHSQLAPLSMLHCLNTVKTHTHTSYM